jgi:hypothetical protein
MRVRKAGWGAVAGPRDGAVAHPERATGPGVEQAGRQPGAGRGLGEYRVQRVQRVPEPYPVQRVAGLPGGSSRAARRAGPASRSRAWARSSKLMRYMGRCSPEASRQTSLAAAVLLRRSRVRFCVQSRKVVTEAVRGTGIASG